MWGVGKFLNSQPGHRNAEISNAVNTLIQRVGESVIIEDRRAALQELRDVLADDVAAQASFASLGFSTICGIIDSDRDDADVLRACLECLVAVVGDKNGGLEVSSPRPPRWAPEWYAAFASLRALFAAWCR